MMQVIVSERTGERYTPFLFLIVVFSPLQGFFDAMIYIRPRYLKYRRKQQRRSSQTSSPWRAVVQAMSVHDDLDENCEADEDDAIKDASDEYLECEASNPKEDQPERIPVTPILASRNYPTHELSEGGSEY
jgi:hypothetical protein